MRFSHPRNCEKASALNVKINLSTEFSQNERKLLSITKEN